MRQQGSDGAKLRHHPHDDPEATATCGQATGTATSTQKSAAGRAAAASRPATGASASTNRPAAINTAKAARAAVEWLTARTPPRDAPLAGAVGALVAVAI